jgi:ABC-type taurine transport system substrate-binding protein
MTKRKKLSNKTGDSVEIKEEGKDVTVTVQYTTKVKPALSATEDNLNDLVSDKERTGFTEEPK